MTKKVKRYVAVLCGRRDGGLAEDVAARCYALCGAEALLGTRVKLFRQFPWGVVLRVLSEGGRVAESLPLAVNLSPDGAGWMRSLAVSGSMAGLRGMLKAAGLEASQGMKSTPSQSEPSRP
ncbi:MAG: hypothetical protein JRN39_03190 [Nitrososphaerota archaeon]|nr:hypothetical protein [Nitrososphaerota archaeon]MDG6939387.1 hypothetical protein [Nitrososphaerota archaeon]